MNNISVLIPTYNRGKYICEAIDSVISQLEISDELIVVDDGSTDNTEQLLKKYKKNKIFKYIKKKHSNAPDTRNRAIAEAKNPWILWIDSDDILIDGVVGLYKDILKNDITIDVLYGNMLVFGKITKRNRRKWVFKGYYDKNRELLSGLVNNNLIPNPAVLVRKSLYEKYGVYNTDFIRVHDYEFWSRVALNARFKNCNKFVIKWRWHDDNMSTPSVYMNLKYEAMVLTSILRRYSLKDIFYNLDWADEKKSSSIAFLTIANSYKHWREYSKSLKYIINSLQARRSNAAYITLLELYYFKLNMNKRMKIPKILLTTAKKAVLKIKGRKIREKYLIASILKKSNEIDLSLERFSELLKLTQNNKKHNKLTAGVCFHIGELFFVQERLKDAKKYLQKTLSLNEGHRKAKTLLEKIQDNDF